MCEHAWIEKTQVDELTIGSTGQGWQAPDEGAQILSLRFFLGYVAVMSRSEAARRLQWTTCNVLSLLFLKKIYYFFAAFLFIFCSIMYILCGLMTTLYLKSKLTEVCEIIPDKTRKKFP